jgi:hypothetical protein
MEMCADVTAMCVGVPELEASDRLVAARLTKAAAMPDGESHFRFESVVFETDGNPLNDWIPQDIWGCDFYQLADTWFQADRNADNSISVTITQVDEMQMAVPVSISYAYFRDGVDSYFVIDGSSFPAPQVSWRGVTFNDPSNAYDRDQMHGDVTGGTPIDPLLLASF